MVNPGETAQYIKGEVLTAKGARSEWAVIVIYWIGVITGLIGMGGAWWLYSMRAADKLPLI